jgi:hypothetical protein
MRSTRTTDGFTSGCVVRPGRSSCRKTTFSTSRSHGTTKILDKWNEFGIPLAITFEFDAAVLYSWLPGPPSWAQGGFAPPIQIPGPGGGGPTAYYAHGFIDQVGQSSSPGGDPAWVFKQFGRDIIDAAREELMAGP